MAHDNTAQVNTYLTPEEQKALRMHAAEAGISLSSYVRQVLREHLRRLRAAEGAE